MGRVKQTCRKAERVHRCPPPAFNVLQFLLELDDAGMSAVVYNILRRVDIESRKGFKGACRKARDLVRRSVTCLSLELDANLPSCNDMYTTHPNVTSVCITFDSPAALKSATRYWKVFLSKLPKLHLDTRLPWEAKDVFDLKDFLCSCHSLVNLKLTISEDSWWPKNSVYSYSFTAHLTSDTGPLENLDQLLPCPPGRVTAAKLAAIRDIPGAFLAAPRFRDNLARVEVSACTPPNVWSALKAAAAASNKPVAVEVTEDTAGGPRPLGHALASWIAECAGLITGTKQLNSLGISGHGHFRQPITDALCQQTALVKLKWDRCAAASLPKEGSLPNLTTLDLPNFEPQGLAESVSRFSSLQQLSFSADCPDPEIAHSLSHLTSLTCLRSLSIQWRKFSRDSSDDEAAMWSSFPGSNSQSHAAPLGFVLPALEQFKLVLENEEGDEIADALLEAAEKLLARLTAPKLTQLTGCLLPAGAVGRFATRHPLLHLPNPLNMQGAFQWETYREKSLQLVVQTGQELVEVALNHPHLIPFVMHVPSSMEGSVLKDMAGAANQRLEHLMLNLHRRIRIGDDVLEHIATSCPNLRTLQLSYASGFTAKGLTAAVKKLPELRILALNHSHIKMTSTAVKALATKCPKLQYLFLESLDGVNEKGLLQLARLPAPDKLLTVSFHSWGTGRMLNALSEEDWRVLTGAGWTVRTENAYLLK